jgi:glycosyltransferase involved in cell wall biosynthesis
MLKISIITAVFNAESTIRDCLQSIEKQEYPFVEHIIIDGGSADGTLEIIDEYKSGLAKVISEPDKGIYDGMNKGLQLATGDIIGLLNADDLYSGTDILTRAAHSFNEGTVDSCYGDLVYVHPMNIKQVLRYWRSGSYDVRRFYWGWMPPHPTFFVRKSIYEKYGLFNLDLGTAADYELMLRFLVKYKISATYIPDILVKMRSGGTSNASLKKRLLANRKDRLAWKVNGLKPYPWTLYLKPLLKLNQYIQRPPLSSADQLLQK